MDLAVVSRIGSRVDLASMNDEKAHIKKERRIGHYKDIWQCLSRNFGKGFFVGSSGMTLYYLFKAVMRIFRGQFNGLLQVIFQRYSAEMGVYVGGVLAMFNGTMYLTMDMDNEAETDPTLFAPDGNASPSTGIVRQRPSTLQIIKHKAYYYRGCFAGAAAGFAMLIGPQDRESKKTLALFLCARALEMQGQMWHKKGWFPSWVSEFEHWDVALMCLANAQILWSWIFLPNANDPMYQFFLDRHGQKPRPVIDSIRGMFLSEPLPVSALNAIRIEKGILPLLPNDPFCVVKDPSLFASVIHPRLGDSYMSEVWHYIKYWYDGFHLAYPLYSTVFTTSTLIFSYNRILKSPFTSAYHWAVNIIRASAFLTSYCTSAFMCIPLLWHAGIRNSSIAAAAGVVAGFSLLIERKGRRMELAMYVFQHACRSWIDTQRTWGTMQYITRGWDRWHHIHICFSVIGFITWGHCFVRHPDCMRSVYRSSADYLLDSDIKHKSIDSSGVTKPNAAVPSVAAPAS